MGFRDVMRNGNGRRVLPALVIFLTLALGIALGTLVSQGVRASKEESRPAAVPIALPSPAQLSTSFAAIAANVESTVVNIHTESVIQVTRRRFRGQGEGPFGDLFERFFGGPEGGSGPPSRQSNLGSGVIIDEKGYILTNHHVVVRGQDGEVVDRIRVRLHGDEGVNQVYEAEVIGTDRETDLAVIKIDVDRPLPHAEFGDSDSMRVGDWVLAVGSPFGLRSSVTAGIISAKGRNLELGPQGQFKSYIQTDAAINPGNSGGPLVNLAGQVIGINTAIITRSRGYDGVGFAIPSKTARNVYNSIIQTGRVTRGSIGVTFNGVPNKSLLRGFGVDHGIIINKVEPNSPAEEAGLERGDVILTVEGESIHDGDQLVEIIAGTPINDSVAMEILRNGKKKKLAVKVADRSVLFAEELGYRREEVRGAPGAQGGNLGVTVRNLTSNQAREIASQLQVDEASAGVLVTDVDEGEFGKDALGIRANDVILEINRNPISGVSDFRRMEEELQSGADVVVLVARRGRRGFDTRFLAARMP